MAVQLNELHGGFYSPDCTAAAGADLTCFKATPFRPKSELFDYAAKGIQMVGRHELLNECEMRQVGDIKVEAFGRIRERSVKGDCFLAEDSGEQKRDVDCNNCCS